MVIEGRLARDDRWQNLLPNKPCSTWGRIQFTVANKGAPWPNTRMHPDARKSGALG